MIGTAVPAPLGVDSGWDLTPLVAAITAILVWRFGLRREVTWWTVGGALLLGVVLASAADATGALPTWGVATLIACVLLARPAARHPR